MRARIIFPTRVLLALLLLACPALWLAGDSGPETARKPPLDPDDLRGPEHCASCHPQQYKQWRGSMHAYSALDPAFQASHRKAHADTQGRIGDFCVGCHVPLGVRTGEVQGLYEYEKISPIARSGVSCEFCHKVEGPDHGTPPANASLRLSSADSMYGTLPRPQSSPAHKSVTTEFLGASELCGRCHDVMLNSSLLERTYAQWSESVHSERGNRCQDCHMARYSGRAAVGGPLRETLRRHDFPGVSLALVRFPEQGHQREKVAELLRSTARLSVRVPVAVQAGQETSLTVSVKNVGAGHNVPTGFSAERQMWIELNVVTEDGKVIFQSGHLDSNGDLRDHHSALEPGGDPWLVSFSDRFLNESGEEVRFLWLASKLEERSLKPLEERQAVYRWKTPAGLVGSGIRIRVRLLFRPFAPHDLRSLGMGHLVENLPIWEMDSFVSSTVPVAAELPRRTEYTVPDDHASLQEAIDACRDGDTVLVRPGEYLLEESLDFLGKNLCVRSIAGATRTTLRFAGSQDTGDASVVVFRGGESAAASLVGFTIADGRGALVDGLRRGGGIWISGASPTIAENTITQCNAPGGVGGGIACENGAPTLVANEVVSCQAERGGAVAILSGSRLVTISQSSMHGNVARVGGGLHLGPGSRVLLKRSVLAGNIAWRGGGAAWASRDASLDLEHVTVVHNVAGSVSGAIDGPFPEGVRPASPYPGAFHCIFRDNTPPKLLVVAAWCLLETGSAPDAGRNLSDFPLFVDPGGSWDPGPRPLAGTTEDPAPWKMGRWIRGDYRLLPGSPAIDSGDPRSPPDPDDTHPDRGAFFFEQPLRAFVRGDLDGSGTTEVADLALLARHLTTGAPAQCADAADVDDSGQVDPVDLLRLALFITTGALQPAVPFPSCGVDPTFGEGLSCQEQAPACR